MSFVPRTLEDLSVEFPPEIQHISASSVNMAIRCEEQWRQVYVKKLRKPPSLAMLAGRADHKAIEISMAQKIETHVDLPVKDVQEAFLGVIEAEVEQSGGLSELEGETASYDTIRSEGQDIVGKYHKLISPTVQPVSVEQEFLIDVPGVPVQVKGYIDLREKHQIIDRKRSARAVKKQKVDWDFQAGIYQLAEPLPYRWHVSVTTKVPQFLTELERPLGDEHVTEQMLRDVCLKLGFLYQQYGPDEPWPATGKQHDWACNYCGFRDDCWAWK